MISPSLLARIESIDTAKKASDLFKLGMSDWTDSDSEKRMMTFSHQRSA